MINLTPGKHKLLCTFFLFTLIYSSISGQSNCELTDAIEIIKEVDGPTKWVVLEDQITGINNDRLETSAKMNGQTDLAAALDTLMLTIIPEEEFRTDAYRIFQLNFVVTADHQIENLYLTFELFWFVIMDEEEGWTQYERLDQTDEAQMEMARMMWGYIDPEQIKTIKETIKAQNWEAGRCADKPVNTLVVVTLNDAE